MKSVKKQNKANRIAENVFIWHNAFLRAGFGHDLAIQYGVMLMTIGMEEKLLNEEEPVLQIVNAKGIMN